MLDEYLREQLRRFTIRGYRDLLVSVARINVRFEEALRDQIAHEVDW